MIRLKSWRVGDAPHTQPLVDLVGNRRRRNEVAVDSLRAVAVETGLLAREVADNAQDGTIALVTETSRGFISS